MKHAYGYSQTELSTLALAKDIGHFVCMDAGFVSSKFGTHVTLAMGSMAMFLSCLAIWMSLKSEVPYWLMIILFWTYGQGMGFADNAGITSSILNFSKRKGNAVGLMKALEGLPAAVMGTIFYTFFDSKEELGQYPLLLAFTALVIGCVATPMMMLTNRPSDEHDSVVGRKFTILTVGLLCYTIFCAVVGYTKSYNYFTTSVELLALLSLLLLVLPVGETTTKSEGATPVQIEMATLEGSHPEVLHCGVNFSTREMLATTEFYLLFFVFVTLTGGGFMFSNNFGQIVKSVGVGSVADARTLITVFSVFNTTGRVAMGFGSEALKRRVNRPWFLCALAFSMSVAFALISWQSSTLSLATAVIGFCLGGTFALQAVVIAEIFGPANIAVKYSFVIAAASIGSLTFGDLLAGTLYDAEAKRQGHHEVCEGPECFRKAFVVCSVFCGLACASGVFVTLRSRRAYARSVSIADEH